MCHVNRPIVMHTAPTPDDLLRNPNTYPSVQSMPVDTWAIGNFNGLFLY